MSVVKTSIEWDICSLHITRCLSLSRTLPLFIPIHSDLRHINFNVDRKAMLLSKLGLHLEETDHLLISHGLSLSFKLIHIRKEKRTKKKKKKINA